MSSLYFDMAMERVANPGGDRVKITMPSKSLPYKDYGGSGNVSEYGFKEG
jgi:cyanate lyase